MTDTNLVVVQLSGGNDYLNTLVPYGDGRYYDFRPTVGLRAEEVLPIDERVGLHPGLSTVKRLYDEGKVAIVMGIGYPHSSRSHFRSMDIWHTATPEAFRPQGWLGKAVGTLDPNGSNPVTAVNFGRGLPRALQYPDVSAASVGQLAKYGLFTGLPAADRDPLLDVVERVYSPEAFDDWASQRLLATGTAAAHGAELLSAATAAYTSTTEYPGMGYNKISEHLQGVATVLAGGLGTRICYTQHGSFDTHGDERVNHARLWDRFGGGLDAFLEDLDQHGLRENTVLFMFSEFGRRIRENNGGTDHGAGGLAMLIGDRVQGGLYGEYPSLAPLDQDEGDVAPTTDFRAVYASILDPFLGVAPADVLDRSSAFTQLPLRRSA